MRLSYYVVGWAYTIVCCALATTRDGAAAGAAASVEGSSVYASPGSDAIEWFRQVKPYCNAVEVATLQHEAPPPKTIAGAGFHAACFALAGRIDDARRVIDGLPAGDRYKAAGIVFDVGHPVADAGDDRSAGPIMEMVIDYWPNHYMALYHAGMAEYMLGQRDLARHNLEEFQNYYHERDGWTANAVEVLGRLRDPNAVPAQRPADPPE